MIEVSPRYFIITIPRAYPPCTKKGAGKSCPHTIINNIIHKNRKGQTCYLVSTTPPDKLLKLKLTIPQHFLKDIQIPFLPNTPPNSPRNHIATTYKTNTSVPTQQNVPTLKKNKCQRDEGHRQQS